MLIQLNKNNDMKSKNMNSFREKQLIKEIKKIISNEIINIRFFAFTIITIVDIKLTKDLKCVKIFYSIYNTNENYIYIHKSLISQIFYFKKQISIKLKLKYIPELFFVYVDVMKYYVNINSLLH